MPSATGPDSPRAKLAELTERRGNCAAALVASGDLAGAKRELMTALELAPSCERAQELLLRIVEGRFA